MTNARARLVLLAMLVLGSVGGVAPTAASAEIESFYDCENKPSNQWCDGRANGSFDGLHSWDYNRGKLYVEDGTTVCQRVWKPSTGGVLAGGSCKANITYNDYGNVQCACYEAEIKHTGSGNRWLLGRATTIWPWPPS